MKEVFVGDSLGDSSHHCLFAMDDKPCLTKLTDEFLRLCLVKSHFAYCRHRTTEKRDSWAGELHEAGKMAAGLQEYEYESMMRGPTHY